MNKLHPRRTNCTRKLFSYFYLTAFALLSVAFFATPLRAQTASIIASNLNVYVGANFNGLYTNNQLRAAVSSIDPNNPVTISVSGVPSGATVLFTTNSYSTTAASLSISNSWNILYSVQVANVTAGIYPLTFSASGPASASVVVNLIVGNLWTNIDITTTNWSTAVNWSRGSSPINNGNDDVLFQDSGTNINYIDGSGVVTASSLSYIRSLGGQNQTTTIAPNTTLWVNGTNGFVANVDALTGASKTYVVNINGAGASLVVSNANASFRVNGVSGGSTGTTLNMTNLDNFTAYVDRVGLGDVTMANGGGGVGAQMVSVSLAKTNLITTLFGADYSGQLITNAFSCFNNSDAFNNGSGFTLNLGITNAIFADSFAAGQTRAGSGNNIVRFNPVFTNVPPYAVFRGTNGGRMSVFMLGVDTWGLNTNNGSNAKGAANFNGGYLDILADTIWLGKNRVGDTNIGGNVTAIGNLTFDYGIVDVNTMRVGYQAYTNNQFVQGTVTVGGHSTRTGLLQVNNNLELGYVSGDDPVFIPSTPQASQGFGRLVINTNGTVRAKQITIGSLSGDTITLANGAVLDVTNTVASTNRSLPTFTSNGGGINVHVKGTNFTTLYVSNLVANAASPINITELSGSYPPVISVIQYTTATTPNNWVGGTAPPGVTIGVANNTLKNTIDVTISSGTPKTLVWKGYVNNNWDTTTKNWLDLTTLLQTNFSTLDSVTFDDTGAFSSINLAEDVSPLQSGTGILVTNNTLNYTFAGSGRLLGGSSLRKVGSQSLTIDAYSECAVTVASGALTNTANGTVGSVIGSAGTIFDNTGTVLGGVTTAGLFQNSANVNGFLTLQSSAVATNSSSAFVRGALATQTNILLYNAGTFTAIGSAILNSNSTFINAGTIANGGNNAGSLNVLGTFKDMGSPTTTLNLTALVISGGATFIPGGDGIGTTTVLNDGASANNGRVTLLTGSTNIFKVDLNASPTSTRVTSGQLVLGPSQNTKIQNGGTLLITNIGTTAYSPATSLTLFRNNFGGNPFNAGLNTTNALPVIDPAVPTNGMAWDLSQVIDTGIIGVIGVPTTPTNITAFSTAFVTTISTNVPPVTNNWIVSSLSWPTEYIGWTLEQQSSGLTNGLRSGDTNWTRIYGSWWTNSMVITNSFGTNDAIFYRMVYP